ncbi:ATP-binding protein [Streptomyces sp. NPDC050439]|uniref:ATP-binding protein n=1 Tax=unclassified Streptomyces TaxID=2593676 RepID=UPI003422BF63
MMHPHLPEDRTREPRPSPAPVQAPAPVVPVLRPGVQAGQAPYPLSCCWQLPGQCERTPSAARAHVGRMLADWGVPQRVRTDLQQIVSELTSNAVTHTHSPQITIEVTLTDDEAAVSVADSGPQRPLHIQQTTEDDEHGRGLLLVEALATWWEQRRIKGGSTVHATISLPQPHARAREIAEGVGQVPRTRRH